MGETRVLLNVNREIHERLFSGGPSFTPLALGDGHKLPLKHLLHPGLEVDQDLRLDELVQLLPAHLVIGRCLHLDPLVLDLVEKGLLVGTSITVDFLLVVILI